VQRDQDGMAAPRLEVLVNSPGPWAAVRIDQPYAALQARGWDVRLHPTPFRLDQVVRPASLVIWQRPLPGSWDDWRACLQWLRQQGCLLVVEWDDHPALFPESVREQFGRAKLVHLQLAHALQCSNPRLARQLQPFHPLPLVVENGVAPIPAPNLGKHAPGQPLRLFLANFNREREHRQLAEPLARWLRSDPRLRLVTVGPSGLEGLLPAGQLEPHPALPYGAYRQVLASCQIALLPLEAGEPQACKTAIKWLEAAAESTAVVAGPELYGPWLAGNRCGLWARSIAEVVPLAQQLAARSELRQQVVRAAHQACQAHGLERQLAWREELYGHLWRQRVALDRQLLQRWPELAGSS